jgi:hypothetical protein
VENIFFFLIAFFIWRGYTFFEKILILFCAKKYITAAMKMPMIIIQINVVNQGSYRKPVSLSSIS